MRAARAALAAAALLAGCDLAPVYQAPPVAVPQQYKETGPWTTASPADGLPRAGWWLIYHDAELSALEARLEAGNPDLAAALAHYQQARALDTEARAALFPLVSGLLDLARDRQSDTRPLRGAHEPDVYNSETAGVQASYDLDLWGRVRNQVRASHASTEAAAADLASARLSLETELADDYVSLLGLDREIKLLLDTVEGYRKALALTQTLHQGGLVSGLDVSRAQALLDSTRAQVAQSRAQRALLEHAIAALTGAAPADFGIAPRPQLIALPQIPSGLPATLLQRRPDIAAAERRTAAANASIGVARAAFFPDVSLSATIGLQSAATRDWLTAPSAYWSLGPNISQYIFDAGLRRAELARARAALDEAGASYRAVALEAFRQVEDELALLNNYGAENLDQSAAAAAAQRTLDLSLEQYRDGAVDYLNVVDSQVVALASQRALLQLQTQQLRASVDLVRALGGGWSSGEMRVAASGSADAAAR